MTAEQQSAEATEAPEQTPPEADTGGEPDIDLVEEDSSEVSTQLSELTTDLQRVTAEYHNYRKRVERDKATAAEHTTANVVAGLLPVLDDIDRAREHGDLEGPFAAVAEQLNTALVKLGLEVFGEKGDPFDPVVHEAVAHMHSPEVTDTSCVDVMRRGYRIGERLLRPAMVAVAEPAEPQIAAAEDTEPEPDEAEAESEAGSTAAESEPGAESESETTDEGDEPGANDEDEAATEPGEPPKAESGETGKSKKPDNGPSGENDKE